MISFRTVLYVSDIPDEDIAYSSFSQEIIELKLDICRVCNALNIKQENINLKQAKRIAKFLNDKSLRSCASA